MYFREMLARYGPLSRVLVPEKLTLSVRAFIDREPQFARAIIAFGGRATLEHLATCPWRLSYEPIPASHWLGIQQWNPEHCDWIRYA
jgi:hypothetical protein